MIDLKEKTAIITGASSGIGAGIAKELASEGVNVVLASRTRGNLEKVKEDIEKLDKGKVLVVPTDVSKQEDINQLVLEAKKTFHQVDILVNNAGQMLAGQVRSGRVKEWEQMIDVNIKGILYGIDAVLPEMLQRAKGHIINISSVSGFEVTKNSTVYSATKFAVRAISMGLEKELARTGVKVTNISPGMVNTRLADGHIWNDRKKLEPTDIAKAVVYALSQPDHVNVNEITVRPV